VSLGLSWEAFFAMWMEFLLEFREAESEIDAEEADAKRRKAQVDSAQRMRDRREESIREREANRHLRPTTPPNDTIRAPDSHTQHRHALNNNEHTMNNNPPPYSEADGVSPPDL
jgi:hypothetical protein